jgi:hypothetical protein
LYSLPATEDPADTDLSVSVEEARAVAIPAREEERIPKPPYMVAAAERIEEGECDDDVGDPVPPDTGSKVGEVASGVAT